MNRFTVLSPNWNGKDVLPEMISSLEHDIPRLGGELVVFDNGSTDGSSEEVLRRWGDRSWFRLVCSAENLGFAAGVNRAMEDIDSGIIVLANTDTVFLPGSLEILLKTVEERPDCGVTGPRLLWPDRTLQRSMRDFPFPGALIHEHIPLLNRRTARMDPHLEPRSVDWLVGAVMVFRRELFQLAGGFDTDYFFYHEETDLQYRLGRLGFTSFFQPLAEVVHVEGASAKKMFGSLSYTKYIRAKTRFLRKHGYRGSVTLFRVFMGLLLTTRSIAGLLNPGLGRRDIRYTTSYCRTAFKELFRHDGQDCK